MEIPSYQFVSEPEAVKALVNSLTGHTELALDLEADSLHSYQEKVCLVQVSTRLGNAIIDPLASRDSLGELGTVLGSGSIQKVFHGADYDVRLLKKDFGYRAENLFDTMVAAQFTGREHVGLAALLKEFFGVILDKRHQRADWSARPLSKELLEYAALDTVWLLSLKDCLESELIDLGRLAWAQEEFTLLAEVQPGPPRKPWCLDVKGAAKLAPRELAVLQTLLEFRDEVAKEKNRPPFKVFGNDVLLRWAQCPPRARHDVLDSPGVPKPVLSRVAPGVLEAVRAALALPADQCPRRTEGVYQPLTGTQERRLKRLKTARQAASSRLRLSPGLLVNSATLERLARLDPGEAPPLICGALKQWQYKAIGEELLAAFDLGSPA